MTSAERKRRQVASGALQFQRVDSGSSVSRFDRLTTAAHDLQGRGAVGRPAESITATLIVRKTPPRLARRHVYLYSVHLDDEVIVADSADPETDLARALHARGISGFVTVVDGTTGRPRSRVNIERAAKLVTREDRHRGPCFAPWMPLEPVSASSLAAERGKGRAG